MSAAKTLGRRLFARAAVGVPTALKMASHGSLVGADPRPTSLQFAEGVTAAKAVSPVMRAIQEALWDSERKDHDAWRVREVRRMTMGGLDPDLAVLNSMALQRRIQIQIDRELAETERRKGWRAWLIKSMGGNPEDFD